MDTPIPAIDMWAPIVPTRELMAHIADHFPLPQLDYLRVFWKGEPTLETLRRAAAALAADDADIVAMLDQAHVTRTLITGFDEASSGGTVFVPNELVAAVAVAESDQQVPRDSVFVPNELVAAVAARHPTRFIPFAGVDILRGAAAVRETREWIAGRGFRGLSLRPFMINLPPDDRRYYPFYELCVELDVPVSVHASANWTTSRPSDLGHPRHFDQVACDFPELKLILSHAGYPWVLEACLLAWKHPNLYLELAAHRPKYFTAPGSGWEPLLRFGQTTIQDKILYGSGAFLIGRPVRELVDELRALPLRPAVMEQWLWRNAARLLGEAS
ncbi:amidohydrolase [bacterium]|nr:amidohydrolase [bacterium]